MYIPDNNDAYNADEAEKERWDRVHKGERIKREMKFVTVPDDYGTHRDCYPNKED